LPVGQRTNPTAHHKYIRIKGLRERAQTMILNRKANYIRYLRCIRYSLKVTEVKAKTAGEIGKKRLFFITKNKGTKKKEPNDGKI